MGQPVCSTRTARGWPKEWTLTTTTQEPPASAPERTVRYTILPEVLHAQDQFIDLTAFVAHCAADLVVPAKFWTEHPEVGVRFAPALWPGGNANLVALASYPRSGNSLLRTLLERLTGVWTGSIYQVCLSSPAVLLEMATSRPLELITASGYHTMTSAPGLPAEGGGLEGRRLLPPRGRRHLCEDTRSHVLQIRQGRIPTRAGCVHRAQSLQRHPLLLSPRSGRNAQPEHNRYRVRVPPNQRYYICLDAHLHRSCAPSLQQASGTCRQVGILRGPAAGRVGEPCRPLDTVVVAQARPSAPAPVRIAYQISHARHVS